MASRAGLLLLPSSDWPAIAPLHAHMAVVRALENGVSIFRPTDGGLSIAADPYGRVVAQLDGAAPGRALVAEVPVASAWTLYAHGGFVFGWAMLSAARFELLGERTVFYPGSIIVKDNPQLESAELPDLVTTVRGDVVIENNANLPRVEGAMTAVGGNLLIEDNPKMNFLGFPNLQAVGGVLDVVGNASLPSASFPALTATQSGITISLNTVLHDISFPTLFSASMVVDNNPLLPACEVEALFARIDEPHEQHGNDETAICSP